MERYQGLAVRNGFAELPVTTAHGLLAGSMAVDHRDPFDRMIAAQGILESLPIVSVDHAIAGSAPTSSGDPCRWTSAYCSVVSEQLRILRAAGLVSGEQHGKERVYSLEPHRLDEVRDWLGELELYWPTTMSRIDAR